ncbi:farnesyl pyrophosphate synthase [Spinellus fusiger]|nr:farnesyl pyrophosphate synthase [Spinellus fusiger]
MSTKLTTAEKREEFLKVYEVFRDDILEFLAKYNMPKDAYEWTRKSFDYNVPGGKLNRGLSVVDTIRIIKEDATEDDIFKASLLGWMTEALQAVFLVIDDITDNSITRRGQPCWYRVEDVGLIAANDALIIQSAIYIILKKYFKKTDYYIDVVELFHEVAFQTELGQMCDLITAPENHVDLSKFSVDKNNFISVFKTTYYSFYLPVALAMHMAGIKSKEAFAKAESILVPLGLYFQVQDDYLDCYGEPEFIGKIGTDILDNKCCWLINQALAIATPEQRAVLDANYGQKNSESEAKVKAIYIDLEIERLYKEFEEKSYQQVTELINSVDESLGVKKTVFTTFMNKIYKRTK